ncbi:MAG: hypothetical protein JJE25_00525 [Bacteroidia bacterium]|nr:hypothetical protein [Bacteroidia bacterium]
MKLETIFDLYERMNKEDIIFSYRGEITKEFLSYIYAMVESGDLLKDTDPKKKKVFNHIIVEALQNVYHHKDALKEKHPSLFIIAKGREESTTIISGNCVSKAEADKLRSTIDEINRMSSTELKAKYLEKLSHTSISEKGGAGLGLLDIARKSGNKLEYDFESISPEVFFFSLIVNV